MSANKVKEEWAAKLRKSVPPFIEAHPVLGKFKDRTNLLLFGSLTMGIDDEFADIDIEMLLTEKDIAELKKASDITFFDFEHEGRPGHICAELFEDYQQKAANCDMDLLFHLRRCAHITEGPLDTKSLIAEAQKPMRDEVKHALFFNHFVLMREAHRSMDNPMERGDEIAVLINLGRVLTYSLQTILVLEGEPYPYEKWLYREAIQTPLGKSVAAEISEIRDLVNGGGLAFRGREKDNPISQAARNMRNTIIATARDKGIDEPWLDKWWLYLEPSREAAKGLHW